MADLNAYFKSIIDQDREAVVICDLDHTILYMNPAAVVDYGKYGGWILLGIANVMFFCYDFSMGSFPALYRRYLKPRISPGAHRES